MKKWYDDWNVTHNREGGGVWTVEFPHSKAEMKKITIKGKYNRGQIDWLISFLELACMELSNRDKNENNT